MSWYAIDAIDRAFSRTKKALLEPFDFWKWVKLAIIVFFVGGLGGSNYGGQGTNYQMGSEDFGNDFPAIEPGVMPVFPYDISRDGLSYIQSIDPVAIIAAAVIFFILLVVVFSYISSIMEFVFVESLVKNEVRLWAYSKKFMGKGFNLLLIRLSIVLLFFIIFVLALLPFIPVFITESPDFAIPAFIGGIFWIFGVIILLALIGAVINSFLSLAIPLSIYRDTGILSAFKMVYRNFRKNWQEVLVYWFIRFLLGIGISLLALILFVILVLTLTIVFLIIDGILYYLFSTFVSEPMLWILLIPFALAELLFIFATLLMLSVPVAVFLKYHLLSFLENWFVGSDIPFFDKLSGEPETVLGEAGVKLSGTEQNLSEQNVEQKVSEQDLLGSSGSGPDSSDGSEPSVSEPAVGRNF
jgi:hypothetical protein